jgi:hypothetical protein
MNAAFFILAVTQIVIWKRRLLREKDLTDTLA